MKTVKEAVDWIGSDEFNTAGALDWRDAYVICFGEHPNFRRSDYEIKQGLVDFADGYRHAQESPE